MSRTLYTIGHSNHPLEHFIALLKRHGIDCVCDVRSHPYSRRFPHFGREALQRALQRQGVDYQFLGNELGARPRDPSLYVNGCVDFEHVAATVPFRDGLRQLAAAMQNHHSAILCAERDPITCHRMILVARAIASSDVQVQHILADSQIETNEEAEKRLMYSLGIAHDDLFADHDALSAEAYSRQAQRIAYRGPGPSH